MNGVDMNGEPAGTLFFLFLPAFSFYPDYSAIGPSPSYPRSRAAQKRCFRVKECCSSPEERPIFR